MDGDVTIKCLFSLLVIKMRLSWTRFPISDVSLVQQRPDLKHMTESIEEEPGAPLYDSGVRFL